MANLADINAAKFTPGVVAELLAPYSREAASAIRGEAYTWRYGDVGSARASYDQAREWARILTADQRRYHAWGAWHANQLLTLAAVQEVMREHGESMHDAAALAS